MEDFKKTIDENFKEEEELLKKEAVKKVKQSPKSFTEDLFEENPEVVATPEQEAELRFNRMKKLMREKTIIKSKITAVIPNPNLTFYVQLRFMDFDIYISDSDMFFPSSFRKDYETLSEEEKYRYRLRRARRMSDAKITFIIVKAEKKELEVEIDGEERKVKQYFFKASRNLANEKRINDAFFAPSGCEIRLHTKEETGTIVNASILDIEAEGILVDCLGVESIIFNPQISGKSWITDAREEKDLYVGKTIRCVVENMSIDKESRVVRLRLNSAILDINMLKANVKNIQMGTVSTGEIVRYNKEKNYYLVRLDAGVLGTVSCSQIRSRSLLRLGEKVDFIVTGKNEELGYVLGQCIKRR